MTETGTSRATPSLRASEAIHLSASAGGMDCFVAFAPLRKGFAFVAGNDERELCGDRYARSSPDHREMHDRLRGRFHIWRLTHSN